MVIRTINSIIPLKVPKSLREKSVNSMVSREIFFIDCLNDLDYCAINGISYHLIRSSVILRMLLLDGGLKTISENYNIDIQFEACEKEISGTPLSNSKIKEIKKTLSGYRYGTGSYILLKLRTKPFKKYSLESFNNKICLTIKGNEDFNFSIKNIINLVANKNGAAHLESTFDSSNIEAFHFAEFNPFSITDGNFYLEKIKEIILILIDATFPLAIQIIKHLNQYNNNLFQISSGTAILKVIDSEKSKK